MHQRQLPVHQLKNRFAEADEHRALDTDKSRHLATATCKVVSTGSREAQAGKVSARETSSYMLRLVLVGSVVGHGRRLEGWDGDGA